MCSVSTFAFALGAFFHFDLCYLLGVGRFYLVLCIVVAVAGFFLVRFVLFCIRISRAVPLAVFTRSLM